MTQPATDRTIDDVYRDLLGECIDHPHRQVGRCVHCKTCDRRLYQGRVLSPADRARIKAAGPGTVDRASGYATLTRLADPADRGQPQPRPGPPAVLGHPSGGTCESCGAMILWAVTAAGKRMPLDPVAVEGGNVAVTNGDQPAARVLKSGEDAAAGEWRGVSHFATCPHADQHRKTPPPGSLATAMGLGNDPALAAQRAANAAPAEVPFAQPVAEPPQHGDDQLAGALREVILTAVDAHPRSQQVALGPSEVGIECPRRLAYRILDWPLPPGTPPGIGGDPWPATVGTAIHAWLADAFAADTSGRWLVEQRVTIAPPLVPGGSCDLFDTVTGTVIDHKCVGPESMRTYKATGPREQYQVQAHLYGLGWELAGQHPRRVALAFYPRGGLLSGLWVWSAPYDRQRALDALARLSNIRDLVTATDAAAGGFERNPAAWELIPARPSHSCAWCPWYRPGSADLSAGCPGDLPPRAGQGTATAQASGHTGKR